MAALPIYLDYAAASPLDPAVAEAMVRVLRGGDLHGNPSARGHVYGWRAAEAVEEARAQVAEAVGCSPLNLVFTSGATESNNLAIMGTVRAARHARVRRRHIISSQIEHKSVLACLEQLRGHGFSVELLPPDRHGLITAAQVAERLTEQTLLVSIVHASSELGSLSDIHAIAEVCRERGVAFHSDCAQSGGWVDLHLDDSAVAMATLTSEKICGPKGVGALYIKRGAVQEPSPLLHGGGQERGLRPGTLATHQVVGMGEAFRQMTLQAPGDCERLEGYRRQLQEALQGLEGVSINGADRHLPTILSVTFARADPQLLLPSLSGIAASIGSACTSSVLEPSHVLRALGLSDREARATLRFSMGRFTTQEEITRAAGEIADMARRLAAAGDLWRVDGGPRTDTTGSE